MKFNILKGEVARKRFKKTLLEPWLKIKRTLILDTIYEVAILWKQFFFKLSTPLWFLKTGTCRPPAFLGKNQFFKIIFLDLHYSYRVEQQFLTLKKSKIGPTYCTVPIEGNILVNPSLVPQQKMPPKFSSQKRKYALTSPSQLVIPVLTFITCNL